MKCVDCGATTASLLYMADVPLCPECGSVLDHMHKGAVWGFEWATVVFMRTMMTAYETLEAEFDEYADNNPEYEEH